MPAGEQNWTDTSPTPANRSLRNPGGRVTPAFIDNLAALAVVATIEGFEPGDDE